MTICGTTKVVPFAFPFHAKVRFFRAACETRVCCASNGTGEEVAEKCTMRQDRTTTGAEAQEILAGLRGPEGPLFHNASRGPKGPLFHNDASFSAPAVGVSRGAPAGGGCRTSRCLPM